MRSHIALDRCTRARNPHSLCPQEPVQCMPDINPYNPDICLRKGAWASSGELGVTMLVKGRAYIGLRSWQKLAHTMNSDLDDRTTPRRVRH